MFCDIALAARIERIEAEFLADASAAAGRRTGEPGFAVEIAGGFATFAEPGSPFNKVAGLGFGGVPDAAALERAERAFAARHAPVQAELATLADPAVGALLTARGYVLSSFENLLALALPDEHQPVMAPGLEVRPAREHEFDAWCAVVTDGFMHPDGDGVPSHEEFPREVIENAQRDAAAAGAVRYVALLDGVLAGGGSLSISGGIARLAGAATAPAHRRRGVQAALLASRLADAAAAGCDLAVITTQPGSASQRNAQRRGFALLYARAVLVAGP